MEILDLLKNLISNSDDQKDNNAMGNVAKAAVPMILMGVFKNLQSDQGANSFIDALGAHEKQDTEANPFNRVKKSNTQDGLKILKHIFGNDSDQITDQIAGKVGVSNDQAKDIMGSLAPVVMEMIANKTKGNRQKDKVRTSILDELQKVDDEPSTPNLPDIFKQVLAQGQTHSAKQSGIGNILSNVLGKNDDNKSNQGGLLDMLGGSDAIGDIFKKML